MMQVYHISILYVLYMYVYKYVCKRWMRFKQNFKQMSLTHSVQLKLFSRHTSIFSHSEKPLQRTVDRQDRTGNKLPDINFKFWIWNGSPASTNIWLL